MQTTIVIGLDGASFNLIAPWIEDNQLPTLKKLISEGSSGDMESYLQPVTAPNWKCYSTGKNPGKLGVFSWVHVDCKKRKIVIPDLRSQSLEIWDYLNRYGIKTAVINMPTTYPPKKIDGIMVSGGPDAMEINYTYPKDLENELIKMGYKVHPKQIIFTSDNCIEAYDEIIEMIKTRFTLVKQLLAKNTYKFIHISIFYINVLHHFLWDDKLVKEAWKVIDNCIGELMQSNHHFFIMSDHGSEETLIDFSLNNWLEINKYLTCKRATPDILSKLNINVENAVKIANILKISPKIKSIIYPKFIQGLLPSKNGQVSRKGKEVKINWDKTQAIGSGKD